VRTARASAGAPLETRVGGILVVDDDIRSELRVCGCEVQLLTGEVPAAVATLDLGAGAEQRRISIERAPGHLVEADGQKHAEVPVVDELRPEQEDAVDQQDRIVGRNLDGRDSRRVSAEVEGGRRNERLPPGPSGSRSASRRAALSNESS
jgi:hypothetical protein